MYQKKANVTAYPTISMSTGQEQQKTVGRFEIQSVLSTLHEGGMPHLVGRRSDKFVVVAQRCTSSGTRYEGRANDSLDLNTPLVLPSQQLSGAGSEWNSLPQDLLHYP
ncbi:uncharacterized protein BDR25DRAFT_349777 [Lindgomyces ingoldianus]|uniref:Uncharacterized protein n=1 Tax=Lindgomyces ingoldianus TaxID=673940 RepID=A0ACB6RBR0_9PLEO|nr:uncharacterized protein BDR25DRAFT_349777 [Lindgomyces ingoldianus]KAF2476714.1 hypothetical protein BDR25DRAFT_349777 [Lindgomyces ingoldianus]